MPVLGLSNNVLGGIYQATASGAIANGKACIINSNGTVSQAGSIAGKKFLFSNNINGGTIYSFDLATAFDTTATTSGTYQQAYQASANHRVNHS